MDSPDHIVSDLIAWWTSRQAHSVPALGFYSAASMPHHRDLRQHTDELRAYLEVLQRLHPADISLEIGLYRGGTHFVWARVFGQVISIDADYWTCLKGVVEFPSPSSKIVYGDSRHAETLRTVETILEGRCVDHLFIDGDHDYRSVQADYWAYSALVRPGGIIAFHDSQLAGNGSRDFVRDLREGRIAGPVQVHEISLHDGDNAMGIAYLYK